MNIFGSLGIVAIFLSIAAAVLALIFITPAKKRDSLPPILKVLHDIFNFRFLLIEYILKFLYIFVTAFTVIGGLFTIFSAFP